jgi:hypothetical protein
MPSPQTPLPERARGFENLQLFLAPLLLLWEKGLGDEGKRFVSQSGVHGYVSEIFIPLRCLPFLRKLRQIEERVKTVLSCAGVIPTSPFLQVAAF